MKTKITAIVVFLLLSLPLLSCIVTSRDIHVEISCAEFNENPTNIRNDFQIETGDKVYVELCSNPSTGFAWSYEMSGDTVLKEEDHDFEEAEGNISGAVGKETWTFEATGTGKAIVNMEYSRLWEGGTKTEWTYEITITVE